MWTAALGGEFIVQNNLWITLWGTALTLASLIVSMTVNALATGLIVFRILKVFHEVKDITTSDKKSLDFTGGRKLCSVIFIIIESCMALLVIQVARVVLVIINFDISLTNRITWNAANDLIMGIHKLFNVLYIDRGRPFDPA